MRRTLRLFGLLWILILSACAANKGGPIPTPLRIVPTPQMIIMLHTAAPTPAPSATPTPSITVTPDPTETPSFTATPTLTPTPAILRVWAAPAVPTEWIASLDPLLAAHRFEWADEKAAQLKLTLAANNTPASLNWVYAPIVPFPTITDDVSWQAITAYWKGDPNALSTLSADKSSPTFVTSGSTLVWLTALLGTPASAVKIKVVSADQLPETLWQMRLAAWSIVPFNQLQPSEKVLTLDGVNVLSPDFMPTAYPLIAAFGLEGSKPQRDQFEATLKTLGTLPLTNRDPSKLTVLAMTGTTALTRATAYQMENTGINLPARDIASFLADADIIHTSNEVAFSPDCPFPDPNGGTTFCARDSYFDLLKTIRLSVVELTGNHVNDWGHDALSHTLDMYDANHILHFGGGRNAEDARSAAVITHNGNTIAFIGCNPIGPKYAWATDSEPGSAPCDDDYLAKTIPQLKSVANIVVMTLQYQEYYFYEIPDVQSAFFHKYAAMGADVVFGSQAHHPQGFGFDGHSFMVYGTGNLFFDQMDDIGTRQMFIDKLIIYDGKHISTTLFTGLNEDYSRPRPMTANERRNFLATIFDASGW